MLGAWVLTAGLPDLAAQFRPDPPLVLDAVVRDLGTQIEGEVSLMPEQAYTVLVFSTTTCQDGDLVLLGTAGVFTDADGYAPFSVIKDSWLTDTSRVTARVTDATGDSSVLGNCRPVRIELTYWEDVALSLSATPSTPVAGSPLTYTLTLSNLSQTPSGPPGITGLEAAFPLPAGATFSAAGEGGVFADGEVRFTGVTVPPEGGGTLTVTVIPAAAGELVAQATVNHAGPYAANNTATLATTVLPATVEIADLVVSMTAAPEPVRVGAALTYTIRVRNDGPAEAPAVRLTDPLPVGAGLLSVTNTAGDALVLDGVLVCDLGRMTNGAEASVTLRLQPLADGLLTNTATVALAPGGTVQEANATNNVAAVISTVLPAPAVEAAGEPAFNPQTGLFEQVVRFINATPVPLPGVRLTLSGLPAGVAVYNAAGTTNGLPYVEVPRSIAAGETVTLRIEFHQPGRQGFESPVYAAVEATPVVPGVTGTTVPATTGRAPLVLGGTLNQGRFLLEFRAEPGRRYAVQYRNTVNDPWQTALPAITAVADVVQWLDDGPPKTVAAPPSSARLYRILLLQP